MKVVVDTREKWWKLEITKEKARVGEMLVLVKISPVHEGRKSKEKGEDDAK